VRIVDDIVNTEGKSSEEVDLFYYQGYEIDLNNQLAVQELWALLK